MLDNRRFKKTLTDMLKAQGKQAERIQNVTEYAMNMAADGQLTPLTDVYNTVIQLKGVNTNLWKQYVSAHVTNIMISQKGDKPSYKKAKKGVPIEVTQPEVLFDDFQTEAKPKKQGKKDVYKTVTTLTDNLLSAKAGEVQLKRELSESEMSKALELAQQLQELLA